MGLIKKIRQARAERVAAKQQALEQLPKICANCRFYQQVNDNGVEGLCTHPKGLHKVRTNKMVDNSTKALDANTYLAVRAHNRCGMNAFLARKM